MCWDPGWCTIMSFAERAHCYTSDCMKCKSEVAQSSLTLCDHIDCSLPGFSIHGIFQARILEWVAISFSRRSSQPRDWTWVSRIVGRRFTIWATREFMKTYRWLTNTWKDAQHHSLSKKCKSKLQWDITWHQSEWPSSKSLQTINTGEDVEKRECSCTVGGNVNWYSHYGEHYGGSLQK